MGTIYVASGIPFTGSITNGSLLHLVSVKPESYGIKGVGFTMISISKLLAQFPAPTVTVYITD